MGELDDLTVYEDDAPRVVMYTDDQDITITYLVADADIKVNIPQPTIEKAVAGLLASYYVWNRKFPTAYVNVFTFINHELLKSPLPTSSTTIRKFIRSRDDILQSLGNTDK